MSSTLSPHDRTECSSPGSSIFDLPTSSEHRTNQQSQAHIATERVDLDLNSGDRGQARKASHYGVDPDDLEDELVPSCLVISGGTGCNAICSAFGTANASYVLPVSDDGGSSSEIIRVIGGPSIGMWYHSRETIMVTDDEVT
jgi:hypothetical protein